MKVKSISQKNTRVILQHCAQNILYLLNHGEKLESN